MNPWLLQHFFNPAFVLPWGAALVASPIIIHLINRMRFRRVRFAAMEFLLQSQQRNRRRLLLEQLLLLLLRILVVLGLLALIARMILDPTQMSIFRGTKAHHLVLLDDSGSMQDQWGETTAFDESLGVVKKLVAEGARRPDTQTFTLILLSDPERPLFTQRDVNDAFVNELETKLENVKCSHRSLDLVAGLEAARKLFAEEKATIKHLHVLSDYRKDIWLSQKALTGAVEELDDAGVSVNLVKTVPERHQNLAVTELSGDLHVAVVGVQVWFKVGVQNFGDKVAENVRLSILQDGQRLPMSIKFDKIDAGVEVFHEFGVTFQSPKKHTLQVGLTNDALSADNTRYVAIDVADRNRVLIVDGDPLGEAAKYIQEALAPDPTLTGYDPLIENVDYLRRRSLEEFQCIYILNVPDLPPDAIEPLKGFVSDGGGLVWYLGDTVNPSFYNAKLYEEGGTGLFPVPLATARRELSHDDETNPGPDLVFESHPIFRVFEGQDNPFNEVVSIYSYQPVSVDWNRNDNERKDGVATLASLRNKQPLMFEHTYGKGRVFTCLTSAGTMWNNWASGPGAPSFVVLQLELEKHLADKQRLLEKRIVGEPIAISLDPAIYTETVEIIAPEEAGERITRLKAAPETESEDLSKSPAAAGTANPKFAPPKEGDLRLVSSYRETDAPGIYRVRLLNQTQVPEDNWIAYNVPLDESGLELATTAEIQKRVGENVRVQIQEPGNFEWFKGKDAGQEIRKLLLILLLIVLIAEQLLAYRLSYHPKAAGAVA